MTEHKGLAEALLDAQARNDPHAESKAIVQLCRLEKRPHGGTLVKRFMNKIGMGLCDCWYWTGSLTHLGYGVHAPMLGEVRAHRFAYRLFRGPIPEGMHVLHTCDVRNCVNPEHLFLGTHAENMRDMARKGRARRSDTSGERNGQARLTRDRVAEIRARVAAGVPQIALAHEFGVSPMTISRAVRRETWR